MDPSQVCFVQMPYGGLERPSIALGLLKAYVSRQGMSATVLYGNLDFAEAIGVDVYQALEDTPAQSLIGEWTFARAAFPEADLDEQAALQWMTPALEASHWFELLKKMYRHIDASRLIAAARERAVGFVDAMAQKVLATRPRIVGCTSMFQQHCASLALLRRVKSLAPDVVTMMGGANCEGIMGKTAHRHFPWLDFVASGEVDAFFGQLCRQILDEGPDIPAPLLPPGTLGPAHRRSAGRPGGLTVLQEAAPQPTQRAVLESLDDAAIPDYSDYFAALAASGFAAHMRPAVPFESSRGCWWGMKHHCTFCGLNGQGMAFRSKSAPRVLQELSTLRQSYGVRRMVAVDNIIDMRHVTSLLPALAALEERLYLFYEVKANLKREQLRVLGDAGVRRIQPGIESMHDEVLKLLNKGNTWFINVQLLKWCQELGISVAWNFLSRIPGESPDWYSELAEWLPSIFHLEPPGEGLSQIRYDRFSPYHDAPESYDLDLVPNRSYGLVYPLPQAALGDLAYFFVDRKRTEAAPEPGYAAVAARIKEWNRVFHGKDGAPPARLTARDGGDHTIIRDSRPQAPSPTVRLEGMDHRVLKACDAAHSREELLTRLRAGGEAVTLLEVIASIERLGQMRLLLDWRGRVLSLPVLEPVIPYLPASEDVGFDDVGVLLKRTIPRGLARGCVRLPSEVPLSQLWARPGQGSGPARNFG